MYLSYGNLAMRNVLIWNLPSGVTCPDSTPLCRKNCYAKKAERPYRPNVLPCRMENLEASKDRTFVFYMLKLIQKETARHKKFTGYFRIHESGDFYSQKYLNNWKVIASWFPDIRFLAFTKSRLDFRRMPKNFQIVKSVWADTKPFKTSFPIYYTGIEGKNSIKCTGGRNKCNICGFKCWHLSELGHNVWNEIH